jgi:pimeloyl-ACP methyl ester carboxylesterase
MDHSADRAVFAADGRRLVYRTIGDRGGTPVFCMHGTPGSRLGPYPRSILLHHLGVRLIAYDRPGYGGSDRLPLRRVEHAASDVETIADALGLDTFAIVGRSGGGPHALACAARLAHRVSRVVVLVGLAPRHAEGLDWFSGMTASNVRDYSIAESGVRALAQAIEAAAEQIRNDPAHLLKTLGPELPSADWRVMADSGIRVGMRLAFAEALRASGGGWVDDARSFTQEWGFDPAEITTETLLWHGEDDVFSPVDHTRWLARRIPGAIEWIEPGAAHFSAFDALLEVLPWLTSAVDQPPLAWAA